MDPLVLRNRIVDFGIAEVNATYSPFTPERDGALAGFAIARGLNTPLAFQSVLADRECWEWRMVGDVDAWTYKRYRMATLQIEFVFNALRIAWNIPPFLTSGLRTYARHANDQPLETRPIARILTPF